MSGILQRAFDHCREQWKPDHEAAMACRDLEDLLLRGIFLFDLITSEDEKWRSMVHRGEIEYSDVDDASIRSAYAWWLQPCDSVLRRLDYLEKQEDFDVRYASEFRSRVAEAKGILTPDSEFFVDDRLVELKDEAIDERAAGLTDEYGTGQCPH